MTIKIIIIIIVYTWRAYTNDFLHNIYMSVCNVYIEDEPAHMPHKLSRVYNWLFFVLCSLYTLFTIEMRSCAREII